MIDKANVTPVGQFQRTHALKGELNAILDIDVDYFIGDGNPAIVDIDGILVPFFAESGRPKGSTSYLIKLQDVDSEEEARTFVNKTIYADTAKAREYLDSGADDEEIVFTDSLVGFSVADGDGNEIGIVTAIDSTTINTLLVVEASDGRELLIPLNEDMISEIDEDRRILFMEIPEGLLDIN